MGAEGKFDLKLAPSFDGETHAQSAAAVSSNPPSGRGSKNVTDASKSTSVLTSRKSSSTPSLPDATENLNKTSVASTEQAASADNLAAKQAAEAIAESVLSVARTEAIVAVSSESAQTSSALSSSTQSGLAELSVYVHALQEAGTPESPCTPTTTAAIPPTLSSAMTTAGDLATIVESLALGEMATSSPVPSTAPVASNQKHSAELSRSNMPGRIGSSSGVLGGGTRVRVTLPAGHNEDKSGDNCFRNNQNNVLS
ncbi:hypothetical protein J437_LFUL015409, partial [Ladona fulva]